VYRFADGTTAEYAIEDYFAENPGKTEQDFKELKKISDAIYEVQDDEWNASTKKNWSMSGMEDTLDSNELTIEEEYIERIDRDTAIEAFNQFIESDSLTKIQKRRFKLYLSGMTQREIAEVEGVSFHAVALSMKKCFSAIKGLQKIHKISPTQNT
jgi:hypothetical protein